MEVILEHAIHPRYLYVKLVNLLMSKQANQQFEPSVPNGATPLFKRRVTVLLPLQGAEGNVGYGTAPVDVVTAATQNFFPREVLFTRASDLGDFQRARATPYWCDPYAEVDWPVI